MFNASIIYFVIPFMSQASSSLLPSYFSSFSLPALILHFIHLSLPRHPIIPERGKEREKEKERERERDGPI